MSKPYVIQVSVYWFSAEPMVIVYRWSKQGGKRYKNVSKASMQRLAYAIDNHIRAKNARSKVVANYTGWTFQAY